MYEVPTLRRQEMNEKLKRNDGSSRPQARRLFLAAMASAAALATVAAATLPAGATEPTGAAAPVRDVKQNGRIVFVRNARNGETDVASISPSGRNFQNLTRSAPNELYIDLSSDGTRIAFTRFGRNGG